MTEKKDDSYGGSSIKVLSGLEPVKRRPGMYTDVTDPNHLAAEVIDNSSDEILGGFAKTISVTLHRDGSASVQDDGRGIPTDIHPEKKVPTVEVIFTTLHAGGKFNDDASGPYSFSGGLHGVGVTVTNALSSKVEVIIKRDGLKHRMYFEDGIAGELEVIGKCAKKDTGTYVRFWPIAEFFDSPKFNPEKLKQLCRSKAVLLAGSNIELIIENKNEELEDDVFTWQFEETLTSYLVESLNEKEYTPIYRDSFFFEDGHNTSYNTGEGLEWALTFMKNGSAIKESYVNLVPTRSGGTHESGFLKGVYEGVKAFISANNLMPKGVEITRDDVSSNLSFLLSARLLNPSFHGQTKEKLNNKPVVAMSEMCSKSNMINWLHKEHEVGKEIAEIVISSAQTRLKSAKEIKVRKVGNVTPPVPGKLSDCTSKDTSKTEVFIVEGESAGGSAKKGRDRETQAVFPLKGKPTNTWDFNASKVLSSDEIHDLSLALGVSPHSLDDDPDEALKNLRYNKVLALTDADVDGYHIETLLTALFVQHFPHLITRGHYGITVTPLYKIEVKGKVKGEGQDPKFYVLDDNERDETLGRLSRLGVNESKITIQRFKGLGEMNPLQLSEVALDQDTRVILTPRLTHEEILQIRENIGFLFRKKGPADSNARKKWISTEGDFKKFTEETVK